MNATQKNRWGKRGKRASMVAVMEQARVNLTLGQTYEAILANFGWTAESTARLSEKVAALDQRFSARALIIDASKNAAKEERRRLEEAKTFMNRVRTAAPMVLRNHPAPGVTDDAFKIGEPLGRSTPKHIKYLMRIRPFVETLEDQLKPFFGGESPLEQLDAVKSELEKSDAEQETLRGSLPAETQKIVEQTGEIFELIDHMNRIARLAFRDSPEVAAQFNTNLIQRAARSGRKVELVEEAPASEEAGELEEAV
jgi:hypothetical protein